MKKAIIIVIVLAGLAGAGYLIYRQAIAPLAGGPAAGTDNAALSQSAAPAAKPLDGGQAEIAPVAAPSLAPEALAEIAGYQYTESYANPTYGFSFKYPKDFAVSEIPGDGSDAVLIQNPAKNIGVQVVISPSDEGDLDLTADLIKSQLPNLKISEPREVAVGSERKGLAFISDNPAFGGESREVWFTYNGSLYQITTYAAMDGFLRGLFGTWKLGEQGN